MSVTPSQSLRAGLVLLAVASAAAAEAQTASPDGFDIGGTTRLRYEAIEAQARAGSDAADQLVTLRTTLLAQYRTGPLRLAAELWDSRAYGADPGTPLSTNEVNAAEMVQAFVEVTTPDLLGAGTTASVQAGRFVLNLGSRRLVAADDYRNTTNGYTGVRADLGLRAGWKATLIYTLPQQRRPDGFSDLRDNAVRIDHEGLDLVLWGGIASRAKAVVGAVAEASFFHLGEHDRPGRPTRDRSLDTASVRLIRDARPARVDFEIEGIVQRGHLSTSAIATAPRQAQRAWFLHADAGYTFAGRWTPRVSIEYDHASGDAPGGANRRFDTLFGMRRADLAPAGLYNAIGRANLLSPGVRVEIVPNPRTDAFVSARPFFLASARDGFATTGVRDPSGRSGSYAGTQIDARIRYQVAKAIRLELDAVVLDKGRFLLEAPNAPAGRWTRYLSLNATATF